MLGTRFNVFIGPPPPIKPRIEHDLFFLKDISGFIKQQSLALYKTS